jgi:hypothetical protein
MRRFSAGFHAALLIIEAVLLLVLRDANLAYQCRWCGTPMPLLPIELWHELLDFLLNPDGAICPSAGGLAMVTLVLASGFVAHLLHALLGALRATCAWGLARRAIHRRAG